MPDKVLLFPSLTDELMKRIRFQKKGYCFFFTSRDGGEKELTDEPVETLSTIHILKDETGEWNQDRNDFGLRRRYCLRTFGCLFGPQGIACRVAVLGLAIVWTSADSKQRGVIPVGEFTYNDTILDAGAEKLFDRAQLRGRVDLSTVLYIAKAGNPENDELHLANTDGYLLGEMETYSIRLDGTGSLFPVFEVSEPGQPLWYVKCDWLDPTTDQFSDCVSINLNTAHRNYRYIDRRQGSFNSQMLVEIMAGALSVIIEKLRLSPYWDQIMGNDALEDGSVGSAVYYFTDTLGWNLSTPESVSLHARKFFEQRM